MSGAIVPSCFQVPPYLVTDGISNSSIAEKLAIMERTLGTQ
jgi:hypothetical protein